MKPYYQHKGITIYHGDCREIIHNLKTEAIITDPPYGINFVGEPTKWQRRKGAKALDWDKETFGNLCELISSAETKVVWGGNYYPLPPSRGWLCWFKPDAPPSMASVELAWTNLDQNSRMISHSISATNAERNGHPTQKPLAVMLWTLRQVGLPKTILDPFMGSGTTLRAAKDMGLEAIGIELEEKYCEIAAKRLQQEVLDFGE